MLAWNVVDRLLKDYQEMGQVRSREEGWQLARVPFEQVYLLELRHVGVGSWQPVLACIL